MSVRETKCIDLVIRHFEDFLGCFRQEVTVPENLQSTPSDRKIDATVVLGGRQFAIEHTVIEPYENQIRNGEMIKTSEAVLRQYLVDWQLKFGIIIALPHDWFELVGERNIFLREVAELLIANYQVCEKLDDNGQFFELGMIRGVAVQVIRNNFVGLGDKYAQPVLALLSGDYKNGRANRINRALMAKIPKLSRWGHSHETVLILESRDFCFTDFRSVQTELAGYWKEEVNIPIQHLFFVNGSHATWSLYPLIENRKWAFQAKSGLPRFEQFDADELVSSFQTSSSSTNRAFS